MKRILLISTITLLLSCQNDQDSEQKTWLTNDSSKLWVLFSHNYVPGDNGTFVNTPPYVFLNLYGPTHLKLDEDFKFSLGNEDSMQFYGNWSLSSSPESSIYLSSVELNQDTLLMATMKYKIMKLSPPELIIRIDASQSSALPYYEFKFKSN